MVEIYRQYRHLLNSRVKRLTEFVIKSNYKDILHNIDQYSYEDIANMEITNIHIKQGLILYKNALDFIRNISYIENYQDKPDERIFQIRKWTSMPITLQGKTRLTRDIDRNTVFIYSDNGIKIDSFIANYDKENIEKNSELIKEVVGISEALRLYYDYIEK